jgi:hypothetical protein
MGCGQSKTRVAQHVERPLAPAVDIAAPAAAPAAPENLVVAAAPESSAAPESPRAVEAAEPEWRPSLNPPPAAPFERPASCEQEPPQHMLPASDEVGAFVKPAESPLPAKPCKVQVRKV